jgi:hypothetical protein
MASAAVIAGGVVSTGGVTALAVRVFRSKRSGQADVSKNEIERRKDDGYSNEQGSGDSRNAG